MKIERITDDDQAKAIADEWGIAESMQAAVAARLPESLAAGVGVSVTAKRGGLKPDGKFEFVLVAHLALFVEGENGWFAARWSEVTWEDLPTVCEHLLKAEALLPGALGTATTTEKLEKYRKEKQ